MKHFLYIMIAWGSAGCWLTDEDALRQQREEYARRSARAKIVRVKTSVEDGLQASLRTGKQAVSVRPSRKARLILTVTNLSPKPQAFRIKHEAPAIVLSGCGHCGRTLKLDSEESVQVSLTIDIEWSRIDLRKDYILLPFQLVRAPNGSSAE